MYGKYECAAAKRGLYFSAIPTVVRWRGELLAESMFVKPASSNSADSWIFAYSSKYGSVEEKPANAKGFLAIA